MRFIDFFAGIGGIRLGLEMAGHECIGYCEFDKYARQSYEAMYDTKGEWTAYDIRDVESVPRADLWTFGFPCQDISLAGKQKGIECGTRSNLFFEIIRLLKGTEDKPEWLIAENVKNLLHINGGFDFLRVLLELDGCGYDVEWQLLNSKNFGVPQNRERVFIIGHRRNGRTRKILPVTPTDGENPVKLQEFTSGLKEADRIYNGNGIARTLIGTGGGGGAKTGLYSFVDLEPGGAITNKSRTVMARYYKGASLRQSATSGIVEFIDMEPGGKITKHARAIAAKQQKIKVNCHFKGETSGIVEFIDLNEGGQITPNSRTINSHYDHHVISNLKADRSGILEVNDDKD